MFTFPTLTAPHPHFRNMNFTLAVAQAKFRVVLYFPYPQHSSTLAQLNLLNAYIYQPLHFTFPGSTLSLNYNFSVGLHDTTLTLIESTGETLKSNHATSFCGFSSHYSRNPVAYSGKRRFICSNNHSDFIFVSITCLPLLHVIATGLSDVL